MGWLRALGDTGIEVSAIGLGTVKLGRDQGVKYPTGFTIPDDRQANTLLDQAEALGINLIDTAPAYGNSEERLGTLLKSRGDHWHICSKVGEEFAHGQSFFNFSPEHTVYSVERSLARLGRDTIDIVLVHSDGNDLDIIERLGTLEALQDLKKRGMIRAFGVSSKTVEGGIAAARTCDVVMLTLNTAHTEELPVLDACEQLGKGALIKKALASGHLATGADDPVRASMELIFGHPGSHSAIIGTITADHLAANVAAAKAVVDAT